MSIKKTVRITDETAAICAALNESGFTINWSQAINGMAARFDALINDNLPELSNAEWNVFYCSQNGNIPSANVLEEANLLHWHIGETLRYDGNAMDCIGSEEAAAALLEKIETWSVSQRIAALYKARAFWHLNLETDRLSDTEDDE